MTRRIPLFLRCSKRDIAHIAGRSQAKIFPAGEALVTEGDEGRDFFVVLDGRVEVTRGGSVLRELGRGDFFGEISILLGEPPVADIVALRNLRCVIIAGPDLQAFMLTHPPVMYRMLQAEARKLKHSTSGRT